ncbi:MAG: hypothetical protein FRX49_09261 [Trebouxia sp. A1-2]|nr:MAG: hypothetical protein FRX49_09261 [Trebouxia sp. A1-2]
MPACNIVRIASGTKASETFWTVQPGGGLSLGSESQAQFFVCHSEVADRSCLIQHLQSGAFVEQGNDRKLKLTLSSASAAVFSKLRAYSQDVGKEAVTDAVWLRATTGGIVCSGSQGDLAVAVNATNDFTGDCSFRFLEADPNSLLMKGLASHTATSCQAHQPDALDISLRLHYPPAPVSIGAKPLSPHFANRSSAMPHSSQAAHQKSSDDKPVPLRTSLPRNSDSLSRSYTLRDVFSNRVPTSPGHSLHSEGSETDENKVRGGHLFDSEDRASSHPNKSSMRSTRSTSALGLIPTNVSHSATHRAIKGHRTHGSQTALNFLSGGYTPSSPHRIPTAAEQPLDLVQSAPVVGAGLLADDHSHSSHVLSGSMNSQQKAWGRGRGCGDNSEALAGLRLSRVSADSYREPMLPCILEGLPSQDSEVTMACPPALDELLGRSCQSCKLQHMTNSDSAAHLSAKVAAMWPQSLLIPPFQLPLSDGSLEGSATVPKGSPESPKGTSAVLKGGSESSKGSPTSVLGSFSSVKGTAPNGKPPARSPKSNQTEYGDDAWKS